MTNWIADRPGTGPAHVTDVSVPRSVGGTSEREQTQPTPAAEADPLAALPLFSELDPESLAELCDQAEQVELAAGTYLFRAGEASDALYLVRRGRLQVLQKGVLVEELGRGELVGEVGLLIAAPRNATVRAVRDSTLMRLTREQFDKFADAGVLMSLVRSLATRLHWTPPRVTPRPWVSEVVVAIIGVDAAAPVSMVAAELAAALSRRLHVVSPGRVNRYGLERAELLADKVLVHAGVDDADWRDFCLRCADRVVLVVADPALPRVPLPARAAGADLVFAGTPANRDDRRAWEESIAPRSMHPVRAARAPDDLRALAARVAGRSIGLVLSGGAARAFAHLGVLNELAAAGVTVDRYAGTSMGAIIAAIAATGMDAAAVDAKIYELFIRSKSTVGYTLPSGGLIRGRRTLGTLANVFGGQLIEELPHEFRCVSVNLVARQPVVHRRGLLADAVGRSLRLPGSCGPVVYGGTSHLDGGVLDNLPVNSLDGQEGPLIAVNIGADPKRDAESETESTWSLGSTASSDVLSRADIAIHADTSSIGLLAWHQIDRAREAGRLAAREAMPQVMALAQR